jgi:hypothetical protein
MLVVGAGASTSGADASAITAVLIVALAMIASRNFTCCSFDRWIGMQQG